MSPARNLPATATALLVTLVTGLAAAPAASASVPRPTPSAIPKPTPSALATVPSKLGVTLGVTPVRGCTFAADGRITLPLPDATGAVTYSWTIDKKLTADQEIDVRGKARILRALGGTRGTVALNATSPRLGVGGDAIAWAATCRNEAPRIVAAVHRPHDTYVGRCPATSTFTATIDVVAPDVTTVRYRWIRDGKAEETWRTVTFSGSAKRGVTVTDHQRWGGLGTQRSTRQLEIKDGPVTPVGVAAANCTST